MLKAFEHSVRVAAYPARVGGRQMRQVPCAVVLHSRRAYMLGTRDRRVGQEGDPPDQYRLVDVSGPGGAVHGRLERVVLPLW